MQLLRFWKSPAIRPSMIAWLLLPAIFCSCVFFPPKLKTVDLSTAGWQKQNGQAIWKPPGKRPELAGDLIFATNTAGDLFLQFTKDPFPIVTAQTQSNHWRIDFGVNSMSFGQSGPPSTRFGWFELAKVLQGQPTDDAWKFQNSGDSWTLTNSKSGEFIHGFLQP